MLKLIWARVQAKHAEGQHSFGVDGDTGKVVDMKTYGLYESAAVKVQTLKTAIEVCTVASLPESPTAENIELTVCFVVD